MFEDLNNFFGECDDKDVVINKLCFIIIKKMGFFIEFFVISRCFFDDIYYFYVKGYVL